MNRLVIIGNGFDMAHGLKTSYMDFINWYWEQRVDDFAGNTSRISEDCLCKLIIKDNPRLSCWNELAFENSYFKDIDGNRKCSGYSVIKDLQNNPDLFSVEYSPFFDRIMKSFETKRWVDIENDYYELLKECINGTQTDYTAEELNNQLSFLQDKLVEYLHAIRTCNKEIKKLYDAMKESIHTNDLSQAERDKAMKSMGLEGKQYIRDISNNPRLKSRLNPDRIMLLSFNYTGTAKKYIKDKEMILNYIHGDLEHPEHIVFGYGDELDKDYSNIRDKNNNELLKKVKSVKYLETRNYRRMLEFLTYEPFQVLIMGHSCGNSDRTLLNTVFEHENCVSIKPYYHQWEDGNDNYLEIVQNISRNFTNPKLFRDRVVNKEQCQTM